jgi:acyl-CoA synthetase (NDP forming)
MTEHRLRPLLNPASIAVVGASSRAGSVGNEVLINLRRGGYQGALYAINPSRQEVDGLVCYPSLADLPERPEQVIFAISDQRIEAAVDEVIALGIPSCTIFSALVLAGDIAPPLKQRLKAKIERAGLLVAGANGMGFYNVRDRVLAGGFDTRDHPYPGNVTLISQSGAGMSGIVDCEERINFNLAVSSGYELSVSMEDYLDFALDLPETRVIGLFLETSRYPEKFVAALAKANTRNIPIVVVKVGRTALARDLALSHSGALAGRDDCYDALFERYGVQRVDDMDQLATALIMFAQPHRAAVGGLVCLHDSGGERQLLADLADRHRVPLSQLNSVTTDRLSDLLDAGLPAINPLDGWGAGGANAGRSMAACFTALLKDPSAALGAVIHDRGPNSEVYASYLTYLESAQEATDKPVFLVANRQGSGSDKLAVRATHRGFPVIDGVGGFLVGVRCLLNYRDFKQRASMVLPELDTKKIAYWRQQLASQVQISEFMASEWLSDLGIPMLASREVNDRSTLLAAAEAFSYPLVLKTAQPEIQHKSDVGGVVLNIDSQELLLASYDDLERRLGSLALVAPMDTARGVEMILGMLSDAQFGPLIVVGGGGIYTEILADVRVLLPPFDAATVARALQELTMATVLDGIRGRSTVDVDSYCRAAAQLSVLAVEFSDLISELDINPLKITGNGCQGLDALVIKRAIGET